MKAAESLSRPFTTLENMIGDADVNVTGNVLLKSTQLLVYADIYMVVTSAPEMKET